MKKKKIRSLKAKIYKQLENIEDETTLHMLEEATAAYTTNSTDILDKLNPKQQERLNESIQQVKEGKTYTNEEVSKKAKQWLSR